MNLRPTDDDDQLAHLLVDLEDNRSPNASTSPRLIRLLRQLGRIERLLSEGDRRDTSGNAGSWIDARQMDPDLRSVILQVQQLRGVPESFG